VVAFSCYVSVRDIGTLGGILKCGVRWWCGKGKAAGGVCNVEGVYVGRIERVYE